VATTPKGGKVRGLGELLASTAPIVRRELLGLLRSRKAFWIAVVTVAATGSLPLLAWPRKGWPMAFVDAREAFDAYRWTFAGALALFVPVVAGSSISAEREKGTWELLATTRLSLGGILLGKLISAAAFFLTLLAFTFPVAAILFLLGGFTATELGVTFLKLAALVVLLGCVGVVTSLTQDRTGKAVYFAANGGLPLCSLFYWSEGGLHAAGLIGTMLVPAIFLGKLIWDARPGRLREPSPPRPVVRMALPPLRKRYSRFWAIPRIVLGSREGIPDGWNPVLVLSARNDFIRPLGTPDFSITLLVLLAFLVVLAGVTGHAMEGAAIATAFIMGGIGLAFPGLAAALLASEREKGRADHLSSTPLGAREVLGGKLWAVLLSGAPVVVLGAMFLTLFLFDPRWPVLSIPVCFFAALLLVGMVSATAGLLAAALSRTMLRALVLAYLIAAGYLIGVPYLFGFTGGLSGALSPLAGYLRVALAIGRGAPKVPWISLLSSLSIAAALSAAQLAAAAAVFERRWLRER